MNATHDHEQSQEQSQEQSHPPSAHRVGGWQDWRDFAAAPYCVLLFYKYIHVFDHEAFADEHRAFCEQLGVRGRILIAEEGINGTVSGTPAQCQLYEAELRSDSRFEDVWIKIEATHEHAFPKLAVRAKKEIVTFRLHDDVNPNEVTGTYLSPAEWRKIMQRDDVVILDGRSDYEWDAGHFEGAIRPDVRSFRDFPAWIREHFAQYKDKTVLTYCTGGIRCEKLSGFLLQEGFTNVAQLHGGIIGYAHDEQVQGEGFVGRCYVFDGRMTVPVDPHDPSTYQAPKSIQHRDERWDFGEDG
jgi:UPF0176 protein